MCKCSLHCKLRDMDVIYLCNDTTLFRSILLQEEFPSISRVVRYLPEFILKEPCKKCPPAKKKRKGEKFQYVKRYVLAEGAHLAVTCPE